MYKITNILFYFTGGWGYTNTHLPTAYHIQQHAAAAVRATSMAARSSNVGFSPSAIPHGGAITPPEGLNMIKVNNTWVELYSDQRKVAVATYSKSALF